MSCLQCPTMYAEMDEKTGEAVQISKPIPLPALNVSRRMHTYYYKIFNASSMSMIHIVRCSYLST